MTYQRSYRLHPGARIAGDTAPRKVGKRIGFVVREGEQVGIHARATQERVP
jgi:hypothetical protein